jgi:hypothetical protein
MDLDRHQLLKQMNVQVNYERVVVDPKAAAKYLAAFDRARH